MAVENYFAVLDYLVLVSSLVICLVVGAYYAHSSPNTNEDLLVGGRNMKIVPIATSLMVSFFSAVAILGYPAEIYAFGSQIYMQTICQCVGIVLSAYIMIPFFYPMKLTTIYEYLELRYNSTLLRRIGALIFLLEQLALAAMILFAPSIALESFLGMPLWISIFGVGVCGTLYTSVGGLKAVVWTDTFQFIVMMVGLVGIMVKCFMNVGFVEVFTISYTNGRLSLFDFSINPFERYNTLNFILGSGLVLAIRTGVHQVQVQRYMSLPNVEDAKQAVLLSSPLKFIVKSIVTLTGLALYAVNASCDPVQSGELQKLDQIVPSFVVKELNYIPGSLGLFTAAIFSSVLSLLYSSLSSQLNSLAAVTWEDFLSKVPYFAAMGPGAQTNVSRTLSLLYGILAMLLAFIAQYLGGIYAASYAVSGVTAGAIIAIFTMGVFMPFVNKTGASVGALVAFLSMAAIATVGFTHKQNKIALPISTEECVPPMNTTLSSATVSMGDSTGFLETIASLSYIMYPFVELVIAIVTGTLVSLMTGGFKKDRLRSINPDYLHPWSRRFIPTDEKAEACEMKPL